MPATSAPRPPAWFRPVSDWTWYLFLVWTAVGFIVMPLEIGEFTVRDILPFTGLQEMLVIVLRVSDAVWMVVAAAAVYFFIVGREGSRHARLTAAILLVGSAVIEAIGAITGFPFGPYRYTSNLGWRIGGVLPFTIPLAWFVVVTGARYLVCALRPAWGRAQIALGTGALALLTDVNLEFIAWKVRAYWIWYPAGTSMAANPPAWPPLQNYISWFVVAALLAALLPPVRPAERRMIPALRPIAVLALINTLFLFVHLVRWWRML